MDQKKYYNDLSKGKIKVRDIDIKFTSKWLEKSVINFADLGKDLKVLDAGCGRGRLEDKLVGKCDIIGVDISAGEITRAKTGKFLVSDVTQLPFDSNVFDRIISMEVVEHLPSKDKVRHFFEESYRILKPGGVLSLSTPNVNNLVFFFTHIVKGKRNPNPVLHPTMLTKKYLVKTAKEAGFNIKIFKTYLFPIPVPRYEYIFPTYLMKILNKIGELPGFGSVSFGFVMKAEKRNEP
ncbi:MAG: class I SAM-dependent methyltransferase [Candidatus Aenigmarchaeota archaeon]|nr:class I SAM-dependent methyltransferase [Candidatus Aenigmarchaeota archaeon]